MHLALEIIGIIAIVLVVLVGGVVLLGNSLFNSGRNPFN